MYFVYLMRSHRPRWTVAVEKHVGAETRVADTYYNRCTGPGFTRPRHTFVGCGGATTGWCTLTCTSTAEAGSVVNNTGTVQYHSIGDVD